MDSIFVTLDDPGFAVVGRGEQRDLMAAPDQITGHRQRAVHAVDFGAPVMIDHKNTKASHCLTAPFRSAGGFCP